MNSKHLRGIVIKKFPQRIGYELDMTSDIEETAGIRIGLKRIVSAMLRSNTRETENKGDEKACSTEALSSISEI